MAEEFSLNNLRANMEAEIVEEDEGVWIFTKEGNLIAFPTIEHFIHELSSHDTVLKERVNKILKEDRKVILECIDILGSIERVAMCTSYEYLESLDKATLDKIGDNDLCLYTVIYDFIKYCICNCKYLEGVVSKVSDTIFEIENIEDLNDVVTIDPEATEGYCYMNFDTLEYNEEIVMYKLTELEQQDLRKQISENKDKELVEFDLYIKGIVGILNEIMEMF